MRRFTVLGVAILVTALAACGSSSKKTSATTTTAPAATTPTLPVATTTSTTVDPNAPTITVTPTTGLTDGQTVTVTGAKFPPNTKLGVTECLDKGDATTAADCDLKGEAPTIKATAADGTYTNTFKVNIKPGGPATPCSSTQPCVISLGELSATTPHPSVTVTFTG